MYTMRLDLKSNVSCGATLLCVSIRKSDLVYLHFVNRVRVEMKMEKKDLCV
jgi:hypothetical protein